MVRAVTKENQHPEPAPLQFCSEFRWKARSKSMHKAIVLTLSTFLALLIFVWGTTGNILSLFSMSFPRLHFLFVVFLIATLIASKETITIDSILRFFRVHRYWLFPIVGFIIALWINLFAFDNIPHVQDEIHYKYMAETMAEGQLAQNMPVHYEFFDYAFFLVDGERHFSIFMPGYSIFLIPFALFKITFLANPILTAINILLVGKLAQHLFDETTSTVSMLLYIVSPFMMTMGGTWMAHPFTATLSLVAVFAFLMSWQSENPYLLLASGMSVAWLVLSRPQNALFLATVILFFVIFYDHKRLRYMSFIWFVIPLIVALGAVASYNKYFTGNPSVFVQDVYFDMSEPVNGCHSILPRKGCLHCNAESPPFGGMTWQRGFQVTRQRVLPLVTETFPHPLYFAFSIVSLVLTMNNREECWKKYFLIALFLSPFVGYFFFYFNGNVYGPRYFYESTMFFVIVSASGIVGLYGWLCDRGAVFWTSVLTSFLAGSAVYQVMFTVPIALDYYQHDFWSVGHCLKEEAAKIGIENSVVFVETPNAEGYGSGLVAMDLGNLEKNRNIFVRDLGDESNSRYMHAMSGRNFFRVTYSPGMVDRPRFLEIKPLYNEEFIHVELEDKFPPYVTSGNYPDYCNRYPVPDRIYPYLDFSRMPEIWFSRGRSLYCRFIDKNQSYTFGQYFPKAGVYITTLGAVSGPVFGDLEIFMEDEKIASIDLEDQNFTSLNEFRFEIDVSEGLHTFRIGPNQESFPNRNYFMIDFIRFEKTGDGN